MKKLTTTFLLFFYSLVFAGCASWFDFDGNGRFDPVAYLENADITVAWVDESGQAYNIALDELGKQMLGTFIQAKTGYLFELTDDGGITITDPDGAQIQVKQKATE